MREGKALMLGELASVGDGVYASEEKEAIVAKQENLLFLAKHRVGNLLVLQKLTIGTFAHGLYDLVRRKKSGTGLHAELLLIKLYYYL